MNSLGLTGAVTAIANAIAYNRSLNEIALIASIFVQIGDTLATIAAEKSLCDTGEKELAEAPQGVLLPNLLLN